MNILHPSHIFFIFMNYEAELDNALKQFKLKSYREQQRECITSILKKEDVFVLWPTGSGL